MVGSVPASPRELTMLERVIPLPDVRVLIALGYFALVWRVLYMIEGNPVLLTNAAFMTIVTLIAGTGGLGIVGAFFFGGTAAGSKVMASQSDALIANSPSSPPQGAQPRQPNIPA